MVDPASGSTAGTQQQQQTTSQPPTLSITVVPLNVLDVSLDGLDGGGGDVLGLDEDDDESIDGHRGSRRHIPQPLSETSTQQLSQSIFDDIVDDVILGIVFEVHRGAKLGLTALLEEGIGGETPSEFDVDETTRSSGGMDTGADLDSEMMLLSSSSSVAASSAAANALLAAGSKKPAECVCPNCQRNMAASRFAPHLEKCMGMGRISSRLASRRIATSATRQVDLASDDDDVNDDDWSITGSHRSEDHRVMSEGGRGRRRMHKKDKNSPRRKKWKNSNSNNSSNNGDSNHSGGALTSSSSAANSQSISGVATAGLPAEGVLSTGDFAVTGGAGCMDTMAVTERRTILSSMCGVVSEHTGRMCTRSLRCPQHTDVQRKGVREVMLPSGSEHGDLLDAAVATSSGLSLGLVDKDKEIDVDTWEEGDSLASLLTAQSHDVPTPGAEASPAESTSTTASSTSSSNNNRRLTAKAATGTVKQKNNKKFKGDQ